MIHRLRRIFSSGWFRWVVQPLVLGLLIYAAHPPAKRAGGLKKAATAVPSALGIQRVNTPSADKLIPPVLPE